MLASARSSVSCTRSSARPPLPLSEMAKARRLGTAARICSRRVGSRLIRRLPCPACRVDAEDRQTGQGSARSGCRNTTATAGRSWPGCPGPAQPGLCLFSVVSGGYPSIGPIQPSLAACALSSWLPVHHIHPRPPGAELSKAPQAPSRTSSQGSPTSTFNDGSAGWNFFWDGALSVGNWPLGRKEGSEMSTAQAVTQHLPFLRRYARALTGSQQSGDSYVTTALEALIADPSV